MVVAMTLSLAACGNGNNETEEITEAAKENAEGSAAEAEPVTLEIYQFKVEIVDQLDALIEDFEAEYPHIDVVIDTVGGGQDYGGAFVQE